MLFFRSKESRHIFRLIVYSKLMIEHRDGMRLMEKKEYHEFGRRRRVSVGELPSRDIVEA